VETTPRDVVGSYVGGDVGNAPCRYCPHPA
jgi:hypothetical protein